MACTAKRFHHALLCPREHVAAGAHGPADEYRLARELVVHGDERVVRRERAGGALAVHLRTTPRVSTQYTRAGNPCLLPGVLL